MAILLSSCAVQKPMPKTQEVAINKDTLGNKIIIIPTQTQENKAVDGETIRTIAAEFFGTLVTIFTIVKAQ